MKLNSIGIAPVIIGATGIIKKNLTEILKTILRNITLNELQLEEVRDSVTILKEPSEQNFQNNKVEQLGP